MQIEARGIHDALTLKAMREVPRHLFVPPDAVGAAYGDYPLPIGHRQTISQPYIVAFMTEALRLRAPWFAPAPEAQAPADGDRAVQVKPGDHVGEPVLHEDGRDLPKAPQLLRRRHRAGAASAVLQGAPDQLQSGAREQALVAWVGMTIWAILAITLISIAGQAIGYSLTLAGVAGLVISLVSGYSDYIDESVVELK